MIEEVASLAFTVMSVPFTEPIMSPYTTSLPQAFLGHPRILEEFL